MMRALQHMLQRKEQTVVVKHTFIEVVEDQAEGAAASSRRRICSDSVFSGSYPEIENLLLRKSGRAPEAAGSAGLEEGRGEGAGEGEEASRSSGLEEGTGESAGEVDEGRAAEEEPQPPGSEAGAPSPSAPEHGSAAGSHSSEPPAGADEGEEEPPHFFQRTLSSIGGEPAHFFQRTLSSIDGDQPLEQPGCFWRTITSLDSLPASAFASGSSSGGSLRRGGEPADGAHLPPTGGGQSAPAPPQLQQPPPRPPPSSDSSCGGSTAAAFARVVRAAAPLRARRQASDEAPDAPRQSPSAAAGPALLPALLGRFCAAGGGAAGKVREPPSVAPLGPPTGKAEEGVGAAGTGGAAAAGKWRTTVMLRNLPNNYSRAQIVRLLDDVGCAELYDFLYLPIDFRTGAALGYAFLNAVNPEAAAVLWTALDGFARWSFPSRKVCSVGWSNPHQGLEENVERYRNSPVMHPSVPDSHKPIVLLRGERIPFPPPTKPLRAPRMRRHGEERKGR